MMMIEKMARAAAAANGGDPDARVRSEPYWKSFVEPVTAVLQALRDPTSEMVFAAGDKAKEVGSGDFVAIYQAMIDAASAP